MEVELTDPQARALKEAAEAGRDGAYIDQGALNEALAALNEGIHEQEDGECHE